MLNDKSKQTIDALSKEDLITEVQKGKRSRFQGEKFDYANTRLAILEQQEEGQQRREDTKYKEKELSLAEEANQISRQSNRLSKIALLVSAIALLVSAVAAIVPLLSLLKKLWEGP